MKANVFHVWLPALVSSIHELMVPFSDASGSKQAHTANEPRSTESRHTTITNQPDPGHIVVCIQTDTAMTDTGCSLPMAAGSF